MTTTLDRATQALHADRTVASSVPRSAIVLGAVAGIAATLQYFTAQTLTLAAGRPSFPWTSNRISDLGDVSCARASGSAETPHHRCSPLHTWVNASFIVAGVLTIVGTALLSRTWPRRTASWVALALWVVAGLGKIVVGVSPDDVHPVVHQLGMPQVPIGYAAIALTSWVLRSNRPVLFAGVALTTIGVGATVVAGVRSIQPVAAPGAIERLSHYPAGLWIVLVGVLTLHAMRGPTSPFGVSGLHVNPSGRGMPLLQITAMEPCGRRSN